MAAPLYRPKTALDVLRLPLVGRVLRWRYGRLVFQIPFFVAAALLLIDGFIGPQRAPDNLATVVTWVHYRGFVVLALLLAGNLFCMGCPFTLTRTLARRLSLRGRRFPRVLRNKWLAIAGLFLIFFLYEWLDLWASPLLTAWVIAAYFVLSFVLEAFFTESAFCKYVCPLGTFNFVYSTASPTQIGIKDAERCRTCVGKECINGSYAPPNVISVASIENAPRQPGVPGPQGVLGCGTELFPPQMTSNLDCTLCLDCVRACPHDNIALWGRSPLRELVTEGSWRSRGDLILLVAALAFMGVSNAFGMVPPVYALIEQLDGILRVIAPLPPFWREGLLLFLMFGVLNLLLPALAVLAAASLTRLFVKKRPRQSLRQIAGAFAPAFVPIGFGIWISHYLYHFLVGLWTIVPVTQEFFGYQGNYALVGLPPDSLLLTIVEIGFLLLGFGGSLYVAQQIAVRRYGRQSFTAMLPWAFLFLLMMWVAVQIMLLPMEMRGTEAIFS